MHINKNRTGEIDMLQFDIVTFEGTEVKVVTPHYFRSTINSVNGREVLTSQFYYDIINDKPYLSGKDFIIKDFEKNYPEDFKEAEKILRKSGKMRKKTKHLLTELGVINILHVYGIESRTLLKGGEKIPLKQNRLFQPSQAELTLGDKMSQIFESGTGLATLEKAPVPKRTLERKSRVYVRDFNKSGENVILGLNKELCEILSRKFSLVQDTIDGISSLFAQIYVLRDENETSNYQLVIRFVPQGTTNSILLARSLSGQSVTNMSLKKSGLSGGVESTLELVNLLDVDTRDISILEEQQTVVANFTRKG